MRQAVAESNRHRTPPSAFAIDIILRLVVVPDTFRWGEADCFAALRRYALAMTGACGAM